MCYIDNQFMCSQYALDSLTRAQVEFDENPTDENYARKEERARLYYMTPKGMDELLERILNPRSPMEESEANKALARARTMRANALDSILINPEKAIDSHYRMKVQRWLVAILLL